MLSAAGSARRGDRRGVRVGTAVADRVGHHPPGGTPGPIDDAIAAVLARPYVTGWARLHSDESATTLRSSDGKTLLTDGPFIDSKEYLAGVIVIEAPLGSVPNRGEVQPDIFLNGVPYLQAISDVTNPAAPIGIHLEPGLWMSVPPTSVPAEAATLVRMASIPHGTTICAQGTWQTIAGAPNIPAVSITPAGVPPFPSQNAAAGDTWRIPQDLTPFITAGTITQAILDDPNTVLRNAIAGQAITSTTIISIATSPAAPLFGGGTDNIAFLLGDPAATAPNAQTVEMTATFWIETVEHVIIVPVLTPGQSPLRFPAEIADRPVPIFLVDPPVPILRPIPIVVTSTQIQYSQTVMLNFNGLLWPHVSVATLVPSGPILIPPPVWATALRENPPEHRHD